MLQNVYLLFLYSYILTPKIKSDFWQYYHKKIKSFLKKNGIFVIVLLVCFRHAKFELGNSIFGNYDKKLLTIGAFKHSNYFVLPFFTT